MQIRDECVDLLRVRSQAVIGSNEDTRRRLLLLLHDVGKVLLDLFGSRPGVGAGQTEILREFGIEQADDPDQGQQRDEPGGYHPPLVPEREPADPVQQRRHVTSPFKSVSHYHLLLSNRKWERSP